MEPSKNSQQPGARMGVWILLALSLCCNMWLARAMVRHRRESPPKTATVPQEMTPFAAEPVEPQANWETNRFRWTMVQSADFRLYLENLRLIGCPAETATNFIARTVIDEFLARQWELHRPERQDFWELARSEPGRSERFFKELTDNYTETEGMFRQLFPGKEAGEILGWKRDALNLEAKSKLDDLDQGTELDFLSEKRRNDASKALSNTTFIPVNGTPVNEGRSEETPASKRLHAILDEQEEEEYTLRHSTGAILIRTSLYGFNGSPGEFRAIAKILSLAEKASNVAGGNRSAVDTRQLEDERLRNFLGAARFIEFKRALDPGFRNLALLAECYGVSTESAAIVYDLEKEMIPTARQLLADSKVTAREKQSGLQDMVETVRQKIRGLFGPRALETYELNGGFALKELAETNSVAHR